MKYLRIILLILVATYLYSCGGKNPNESNSLEFASETEYNDGSMLSLDGVARIFTDIPFNWSGEVDDRNYANGHGTITFEGGDTRYEGNVEHGRINGFGTEYLDDVLTFKGYWKDGKYFGNGASYYDNGKISYLGEWLNGEKNGNGVDYYYDGTKKYEGEFTGNNYNGFGELYGLNVECYRRGYFEDGAFRDELKAQSIASEMGREVVKEIFNGGKNINTTLYSVKYNKDQSEIEIVIDLSFNGDIISDNEYYCRVACRNYYPETEFLQKNSTAENYLNAKTVIGGALTGINIYNELFNN